MLGVAALLVVGLAVPSDVQASTALVPVQPPSEPTVSVSASAGCRDGNAALSALGEAAALQPPCLEHASPTGAADPGDAAEGQSDGDWSIVASPNAAASGNNFLNDVTCVSASDCWAVGYFYSGSAYQTLVQRWDGSSWAIAESANTSSTQHNYLFDVTCVSASDCWAVGYFYSGSAYQALVQRWDGNAWTIVASPDTSATQSDLLYGVTCTSSEDCWAVGSSRVGVNGGGAPDQTLIRRWDGTMWADVPSPNTLPGRENVLADVACVSASECWAVGRHGGAAANQTLVQRWDGSAWSIVRSPSTSPVRNNTLSGLTCASASDCWAVGYHQTDAAGQQTLTLRWDGTSWAVIPSPNNSETQTNLLFDVACASASSCWAVGYHRPTTRLQNVITRWDGSAWAIVESPNTSTGQTNTLRAVTCTSSSDCWAIGNYYDAQSISRTLTVRYSGPEQPASDPEPAPSAYPRPGWTERVSVAGDGSEGNDLSWAPSISADARFVAFDSRSANLVPEDTNGAADVFVHDRQRGTTERVSVASDGTEGDADSAYPAVSADGRYVAFMSWAANLVPGQTRRCVGFTQVCPDVFVHDRETGETERVSVASDGTESNEGSGVPTISADGRYVAFDSVATNLVPDDLNNTLDVFVHDRQTGVTEKVSVASDGTHGGGASYGSHMTPDGRYVAFQSLAENLVEGDTNRDWDVFLHDRVAGTTERVSVGVDGREGNAGSYVSLAPVETTHPVVSSDGRYVAFYSDASNLIPGDTNGRQDVFVRDRVGGTTERVSVGVHGEEADGYSANPSISADGRYVAFHSLASNLVPGDTNDAVDVFVRDRATAATERVSVGADGAQGDGHSYLGLLSPDGRHVAFTSWATNLVPGPSTTHHVFVRDRGPAVGIGHLAVALEGDSAAVSGWATLSGQVVAAATDPPDDGAPGAGEAGAELTGASVTYRPEDGDLLVRLQLASLPHVAVTPWPAPANLLHAPTTGAAAPVVVYGLEFEVGGRRYEVRALRAAGAAVPPAAPYFALYRCATICEEQARLSGGIGTTGDEALVSVPASALGASAGSVLEDIRAFTALGEGLAGQVASFDELQLPDAELPAAQVRLGLAPATTPDGDATAETDVAFDTAAALAEGSFSGAVNVAALPAGPYRVWARACLGDVCGTTSVAAPL